MKVEIDNFLNKPVIMILKLMLPVASLSEGSFKTDDYLLVIFYSLRITAWN